MKSGIVALFLTTFGLLIEPVLAAPKQPLTPSPTPSSSVPVLLNPTGTIAASESPNGMKFTWERLSGATHYQLEIIGVSLPAKESHLDADSPLCGKENCTMAVHTPLPFRKYSWRVREYEVHHRPGLQPELVYGNWSLAKNFEIKNMGKLQKRFSTQLNQFAGYATFGWEYQNPPSSSVTYFLSVRAGNQEVKLGPFQHDVVSPRVVLPVGPGWWMVTAHQTYAGQKVIVQSEKFPLVLQGAPKLYGPRGDVAIRKTEPMFDPLPNPIFKWDYVLADTYVLTVTKDGVNILTEEIHVGDMTVPTGPCFGGCSFASPFAIQQGPSYSWSVEASMRGGDNKLLGQALKSTPVAFRATPRPSIPVAISPSGVLSKNLHDIVFRFTGSERAGPLYMIAVYDSKNPLAPLFFGLGTGPCGPPKPKQPPCTGHVDKEKLETLKIGDYLWRVLAEGDGGEAGSEPLTFRVTK